MWRVPRFFIRLGFGEPRLAPDGKRGKVHSPNCVCHKFLAQQLAQADICGFGGRAIVPDRRNGVVIGWRLTGSVPNHIFYSFGLREQDLITAINGERCDLIESQKSFRHRFCTDHFVEFDIQRDGRSQSLRAERLDSGEIKVSVAPVFGECLLEHRGDDVAGFRIKPVLDNGKVIGMRVNLANPEHPLGKLGLRDRDVVLSVNEVALTGPESLSSVYRLLRTSDKLEFEVIRDGQQQTVTAILEE